MEYGTVMQNTAAEVNKCKKQFPNTVVSCVPENVDKYVCGVQNQKCQKLVASRQCTSSKLFFLEVQ